MNILIVEDDLSSQLLFDRYLRQFGPTIKASDGLEAQAIFEASLKKGPRFDLICLDIMLPGLNGQQLLKAFRKKEEEVGLFGRQASKILMITALADSENILSAFRFQCEGYLTKPIEYEKLVKELINLELIPATTPLIFKL